jgi:hypothetical protein
VDQGRLWACKGYSRQTKIMVSVRARQQGWSAMYIEVWVNYISAKMRIDTTHQLQPLPFENLGVKVVARAATRRSLDTRQLDCVYHALRSTRKHAN